MPRIFVTTFRDGYACDRHADLFNVHRDNLKRELDALPSRVFANRQEFLIRRARLVQAHRGLLAHIRAEIPTWRMHFHSKEKLLEWIDGRLESLFASAPRSGVVQGDMPDIEVFREGLRQAGLHPSAFPKKDPDIESRLSSVPGRVHEIGMPQAAPAPAPDSGFVLGICGC